MNISKRKIAEKEAAIYDIYWAYMTEWEDYCRSRSSTGENMVRESMEYDEYQDLKKHFRTRAEQAYEKTQTPFNQ